MPRVECAYDLAIRVSDSGFGNPRNGARPPFGLLLHLRSSSFLGLIKSGSHLLYLYELAILCNGGDRYLFLSVLFRRIDSKGYALLGLRNLKARLLLRAHFPYDLLKQILP